MIDLSPGNLSQIDNHLLKHPQVGALVQVKRKSGIPQTIGLGAFSESSLSWENQRFPIYSLTKTVLAVIFLKLIEEKKLQFDARLSDLLDRELPSWMDQISLIDLLDHRSGLADYGSSKKYHDEVKVKACYPAAAEKYLKEAFAKGPLFPTRTSFNYSNLGYFLIKEILEKKTHLTLQELFDNFIGKPFGISMELLNGHSFGVMPGFSDYFSDAEIEDIRSKYDFSWVFHGSFAATISEINTFYASLPKILEPEMFSQMTLLHKVDSNYPYYEASYGLGLMGDLNSKYGPFFGHTGSGPGYSIATFNFVDNQTVISVVVNSDRTFTAEHFLFIFLLYKS